PEFLRWPNHDNSWAWLGQEFWELKSTGCKGAIVMPLLSCQYLQGHRELYLAHLVLSFITMGYVWQEGEKEVLPRNLAIPFGEVSEMLGLPPILVHTDFVLVNWKKKNPQGNLEPIVTLPGGTSTVGFILVSLLFYSKLMINVCFCEGLRRAFPSILADRKALLSVGPFLCNPLVPFLFFSWKDNPVLPEGLLYEGLCEEPLAYSGGSAAQSSTLHAFDELLGIQHQKESGKISGFLHRMRKYMPPHHQAFIEEIRSVPRLRDHVLSSGNQDLQSTYNKCVAVLSELRTYHITLVTKYIIIAAKKAKNNISQTTSPPSFLEVVGTGGSRVLKFLKSVRDTTKEAMIQL
uniref:Indoleamine 2,3-dioxygenase 2 n=1 Tax=Laticauda laticaudata TaxID=8630 RepID=A0A8C5SWC2_LATLA